MNKREFGGEVKWIIQVRHLAQSVFLTEDPETKQQTPLRNP